MESLQQQTEENAGAEFAGQGREVHPLSQFGEYPSDDQQHQQ